MKRVGGLFDRIHAAPVLAAAAWRAARGKRERPAVRAFLARLERNVERIGSELRAGTYRFGPYASFPICDPKTRMIRAPSFQDRVVHHAIVAVCGPVLERGAIPESFACRLGRGTLPALELATRHARSCGSFLKLDVAKFYDTIHHGVLRQRLRRRFREERLLALFDALLDSYATAPGKGLPIGALSSQYLGNFTLDPIDAWARAQSGARCYLRYMDDMLFFGEARALRGVRREAEHRLALLGLEAKQGGVLNHCRLGVPWLGFTLYPNRIRLDARGRKRLRSRLARLERGARRGRISEREVQARAESLLAHARQADDAPWRRAVLSIHSYGEALELDRPRQPGWLLERHRQELPLREPQQEEALQPQQESGLPCLSAPRHGGAETPPDDAPSRAPLASAGGDETRGRTPAGAEIQRCPRIGRSEEKEPAGAPPSGEGAS